MLASKECRACLSSARARAAVATAVPAEKEEAAAIITSRNANNSRARAPRLVGSAASTHHGPRASLPTRLTQRGRGMGENLFWIHTHYIYLSLSASWRRKKAAVCVERDEKNGAPRRVCGRARTVGARRVFRCASISRERQSYYFIFENNAECHACAVADARVASHVDERRCPMVMLV